MTTSHRVDGLAFLNDDVVGECKHNRQIHKKKKSGASVGNEEAEGVTGV